MLYDVLAVIFGFLLGFLVTWRFVEVGVKKEGKERVAKVTEFAQIVEKKQEVAEKPSNLEELVKYISTKYMLAEVTLLTPEGLPIVSNSSSVDEDTATAPEMLKIANKLLNSDRIFISSGEIKIVVVQINPQIIMHAKVMRELSKAELEKMKLELNSMLEGMI
uniref:Roadblock/LAMTOR2 domain-containing protein n=1 Tax=Archaeoglobus fulgidus TaxID=2234 RepID=A0A7J2THD0_ARCFL